MSRATERVYLAYRSSDEEGNLALASPFIADVAELLAPGLARPPPPAAAGRRRVDGRAGADPRERERVAGGPAGGGRRRGGGRAARVLGAGALAKVRHSQILSAGALETYGDCPVKWLIERELQPQPLTPEPEPITRGNVMHDVLERLLRELDGPLTAGVGGDRRVRSSSASWSSSPTASDASWRRAARSSSGPAPYARSRPTCAGTWSTRRARGGGWRPLGLELRFGFSAEGEQESLPPLELGEGDDRVLVRGMIDRVDVDDRGHALVRDYKSGARRPDWSGRRWSTDRRLQVALYMLVVRELLGLEPVAGFYQPLRGDDLRARGVFVRGEDGGAGAVTTDARDPAEVDAHAGRRRRTGGGARRRRCGPAS